MDIKLLFMFLMLRMASSYKYTNINKNKIFLKPLFNKKRNYRVYTKNYILWEDGEIEWEQGELPWSERNNNITNSLPNNNIKFNCNKNCKKCNKF